LYRGTKIRARPEWCKDGGAAESRPGPVDRGRGEWPGMAWAAPGLGSRCGAQAMKQIVDRKRIVDGRAGQVPWLLTWMAHVLPLDAVYLVHARIASRSVAAPQRPMSGHKTKDTPWPLPVPAP
jgi:hypothetical protein